MNDLLVENEESYRALTLSDRCDRCPNECSQAFVRVVKQSNELLFCGHHFHEHEPVLVAQGWLVQDERNKINFKPMSGSPEGALVNEE
jgi:hypothetical protein